jgi:hypothetical protein
MRHELEDDDVIGLIRRGLTPLKIEVAMAGSRMRDLAFEFEVYPRDLTALARRWGIKRGGAATGEDEE